jgi:hypothetical protein
MKIEIQHSRIACHECANRKLPGYKILFRGIYEPIPEEPFTFIRDVILEDAEHRLPQATHDAPSNQLH